MISLLRPPVFHDEEKTLNARLLHSIIWTCMLAGWSALFISLEMPETTFRWLWLIGSMGATGLILLILNGRGYTRTATNVMIFAIWATATVMALTGGGIHSNAMVIYMIAVLVAGLMQSGKAGIGVAIFCSLTGLSFVYLEYRGLLPASRITHSSLTLWIAYTADMTVIIVLQFLVSRTVRDALRNSQRELRNRLETDAALRESEEKYRSLFETSAQGIIIYDGNGTIQMVNHAVLSLLGVVLATLMSMTLHGCTKVTGGAVELSWQWDPQGSDAP